MITDVTLGVVDEQINVTPSDASDPFLAEVLAGTSTFGTLHVLPMLTIGGDVAGLLEGPQPVKTVPSHFSAVEVASQKDVELVFGGEDEEVFYRHTSGYGDQDLPRPGRICEAFQRFLWQERH